MSMCLEIKKSKKCQLLVQELALDNILGGGVARGRVIEVLGPEASGKTSIAMTVLF